MSSPNDPGPPRTGDEPGSSNGSGYDAGPGGPPTGDVPPWERGAGRNRTSRVGEGPPQDGPRPGASVGHPPGADARLNRFMSGGPGAAAEPNGTREPNGGREAEPAAAGPRNERSGAARPDTYASELPDLSDRSGRPARKPAGERAAPDPSTKPPTPATRPQVSNRAQGPVRASMQIRRFDPWSVLKVSVVLNVALFFVWMIAIAFLYLVLGGMGVWSKLNSNVGDLLTSATGSGGELVSSGTIFGGAALVGLVNIVLLTAMATAGAFIYNLTTDIVGGIEVTLADRD